MKIFKYLFSLALAVITLTSCDTDNIGPEYSPANLGLTFAQPSQSVSLPATGYEGFDVELLRGNDISSEATVNLKSALLDSNGNENQLPSEIAVPSSVTFKAGENKATIHVSVGNIKSGVNFNIKISIADENEGAVDANVTKTVTLFRDYTFSEIGEGTLISEFFGAQGTFKWLKADDINWYKVISPYEDGYDIVFKIGADGRTVTVEKQAIMPKISSYKTLYVQGSGTLEDGKIIVKLKFTVAEGSFGETEETFVLPTK